MGDLVKLKHGGRLSPGGEYHSLCDCDFIRCGYYDGVFSITHILKSVSDVEEYLIQMVSVDGYVINIRREVEFIEPLARVTQTRRLTVKVQPDA